MPLIEAGAAAIGAVKTAMGIVRDVRKSNDVTILKTAINDLTGHLSDALAAVIDLQIENAACNARCREFEASNGKLDEFKIQRERYARRQTGAGGFIYVEAGTPDEEEASPKLCANCFENGERKILQPVGVMRMFKCSGCGGQQKV